MRVFECVCVCVYKCLYTHSATVSPCMRMFVYTYTYTHAHTRARAHTHTHTQVWRNNLCATLRCLCGELSADVGACDTEGRTALHAAAALGHSRTIACMCPCMHACIPTYPRQVEWKHCRCFCNMEPTQMPDRKMAARLSWPRPEVCMYRRILTLAQHTHTRVCMYPS